MSTAAPPEAPLPAPDRSVSAVDRLNTLLLSLPVAELEEAHRRVAAEAFQHGVWMERDGQKGRLEIELRPRLLDLAARGYLHHATWQLRLALRRIPQLVMAQPAVRAVLPASEAEWEWLERYRTDDAPAGTPQSERLFCRFDSLASFDGPGWVETLRFIEVNVVGVGGIRYAPVVEQAVLRHLAPLLEGLDEELALEPGADPRELLLDELVGHARGLGLDRPPRIALVDDKEESVFGGECGQLAAWYTSQGHDVVAADPGDIEVAADGTLVAFGAPVDVCYRTLELRELIDLEAAGRPMAGMRAAFARGAMVPTVGGDLEHKSVFELLTSQEFAPHFTPAMRRVIDRHVLWTRLVRNRRTHSPDRKLVDLLPWARTARDRLVLKPNRAYGGIGVVLGRFVDDRTWDASLHAAALEPDTYVLQEVAPLDVEPFPVLDRGTATLTPLYGTTGFFPGRRGLAVLGRTARSPVVNISAGGSMCAFLVSVS